MKTAAFVLIALPFVMPFIALGALVPSYHPLFADDEVQEIWITFDDANFWSILEQNYGTETYLEATFQWNDYTFETVGVRFKGASSYFGNRSSKKSFKIDFDEFVDFQNIDGIYKINLNCNVNDPSFIREAAAYEIATAAGIPCPRTSFAALYINGTYWGLYTLVEQYDKHFIEGRFGVGEDGNLWKGDEHGSLEFFGWDVSLYYDNYELKTNETSNDWSSLVELCYYLDNTETSQLPTVLSEVMDVNTGLLLLAVDNLLVNLDSYAGRCVNYYLYQADRDDRFVFGEWDMNESWGVYNSWQYSVAECQELELYWLNPDAGEVRSLADALWSVDEYTEVYEGHLLRMLATDANPSVLIPRMEEMRDLIRDWVYLEESPRQIFTHYEFENSMNMSISLGQGRVAPALGTFVEERYNYLSAQLGTWTPVENLILNELMAGNDSTITDSSGDYDDWVEIVNTGTSAISLSGFFLTDDMAFPEKYAFPDTVIQPGEYMILWTDNETEEGPLHTGFRLNGKGEEVYLMQGAVLVDWITCPALEDDVSWGRWLDLEDSWEIQAYPTPGSPNSDEDPQQGEEPAPNNLSIFCSNPIYAGTTSFTLTGDSGLAEFTIYDMSGRVVAVPFQANLVNEQDVSVDTSVLSSGVYIIRLAQKQNTYSSLVTVIR